MKSSILRDKKWLLFFLAASLLLPLLLQGNNYFMDIFLLICVYVVLVNGLNILMGFSGQLSLGHAAFFGVGAYVCSILRKTLGVNFLFATIAAIGVCVLLGIILGLPACKQKGIFLALITVGFNTIIQLVLINWKSVTNGSAGFAGIPKLRIAGEKIPKLGYCYIYLGIVLLVMLLTVWIMRSKIGRGLIAVRDSEIAAQAMGINVTLYKCMAFALSAAMAGIAGSMYSANVGYIDPTTFSPAFSMTLLAMVIIGGMGNLWGGVVGAVFIGVSLELLRGFAAYQQLAYGVVMILVIRFMPDGIMGAVTDLIKIGRGKRVRTGGEKA